jgi:hypothetical protein
VSIRIPPYILYLREVIGTLVSAEMSYFVTVFSGYFVNLWGISSIYGGVFRDVAPLHYAANGLGFRQFSEGVFRTRFSRISSIYGGYFVPGFRQFSGDVTAANRREIINFMGMS